MGPLCWQVTGIDFLLQIDTIFQCISLVQIGTVILHSMLSWAFLSSQLVGKCQT